MDESELSSVDGTMRGAVPGMFAAYVWKNVGIVTWLNAPTLETLTHYERICREFIDEHPEGVSSLSLIIAGAALPAADVRHELTRIIDEQAHHIAAAAVIVRGEGFWASALRGLVTALHMLARKRMHQRIFSDCEQAVSWLAGPHAARTGTPIDAAELLALLRSIESRALASATAA